MNRKLEASANKIVTYLLFAIFMALFAFNDVFQYSGFATALHWSYFVCIGGIFISGMYLLKNPYIKYRFYNGVLAITGIGIIITLFIKYSKFDQVVNVFSLFIIMPFVFSLAYIRWNTVKLGICSITLMVYATLIIRSFLSGHLFSGWNSNSATMLIPVLICAISMAVINGRKLLIVVIIIFILASVNMIYELENRNAINCLIIFAIVVIFKIYQKGRRTFRIFYGSLILVNLIVPVISDTLKNLQIYTKLLEVSTEWFGKDTLFNGREKLWNVALERIQESLLLGNGGLRELYTHNMSLDLLIAVGIAGWIFFIVVCIILMESAFRPKAKENIFLYGFATLFLLNTFENVMVCNYVLPLFQYMLIAIPLSIKREGEKHGNCIYTNV